MKLSYECELKWDDLKGDSPRRRYCLDCKQHVYNISAMTKAEAEELVELHQGNLCVRLKTRDGDILHTNDPAGQLASQIDGGRRLALAAAVIAPFFALAAGRVAPASFHELGMTVDSAYQQVLKAFADDEECDLRNDSVATGVVF